MKFRRVSWLQNVLVGSVGTGSPPTEKTSGKKSLKDGLKQTGSPEVLHKPCCAGYKSRSIGNITCQDRSIHCSFKVGYHRTTGRIDKSSQCKTYKKQRFKNEQVLNTVISYLLSPYRSRSKSRTLLEASSFSSLTSRANYFRVAIVHGHFLAMW